MNNHIVQEARLDWNFAQFDDLSVEIDFWCRGNFRFMDFESKVARKIKILINL